MLSVTLNANGNATILCVRPCVTPSALVRNVKCNARRHPAQNAPCTANSHSVPFVARRTCVKRKIARNVRPSALPQNATPLAWRRKRIVLRCARKPNATGRARSRPRARVPNANCNAKNPNAISPTKRNTRNAARARAPTSLPLLPRPMHDLQPKVRSRRWWSCRTTYARPKWTAPRPCAARAHEAAAQPIIKSFMQ